MSISLKPSALEEAIQKTSVVLFHAPWCGHCTRFKPVFEAFAAEAKETLPELVVAKMNHDKYYKDIEGVGESLVAGGVAKYIRGYPTIAMFHKGEMSLYTGSRDSTGALFEGIRRFTADVEANGPSNVIRTEEELLSVDEGGEGQTPDDLERLSATKSLVLLYAPWCGHCTRTKPEFEKAAALLEKSGIETAQVDFDRHGGEIKARKIADRMMAANGHKNGVASVVKGYPTILMFSGTHVAKYTGPRTAQDMADTVQDFVNRYGK